MGVFRASVLAALLAAFALASAARASEDIKGMAQAVAAAAAARQVKRVAVVPFTAPRGAGSFSGAVVSERLVIQILARGELDLIERRFLDKILEEQRLGVFGIMDQDTVKTLGKVLGVDAILTGTIVELKGERVEINARLIHAETAQVLAADTVNVAKDWEERSIGEDPSTWIVPVPDLGDEPFKSGASCRTSVDEVERRIVDFKARYWAERLKDPAFSIRSLKRNPGSEIMNAEIKKRFFLKLQERYDSPARTPLTPPEQAALARGLQEIQVLSRLCEG
ncbi:MAG: FlgO family outer membrane protein [Elusimicrobiota bacterium]|nr:FlgO family outer membrane protein [Elusimicrobiota bacterium]